jgi:putative cell wall-binding protein
MTRRSLRRSAAVTGVLVVAALMAAPGPAPAATVQRLAGSDRYATAAAVSAATFPSGVPLAIVASGESFADALAAGPAAGKQGPVLLTRLDALPAATASELDRLNPLRIIVAGGPNAVAPAVVDALRRYTSGAVTRIAGQDRIATAAALSAATFAPGVPIAFVATASTFPDALAAGAAGAALNGPVLLTNRDALPPPTAAELDRLNPGQVIVLGGFDVVTPEVEEAAGAFSTGAHGRAAGNDRFGTAEAVAGFLSPPHGVAFVASGRTFADALTAAPAAGRATAPVLLAEPDCVHDDTREVIDRFATERLVVLGGPQALSTSVETLAPCPNLAEARVVLTEVARLSQPVALAVRPNDGGMYVAEKGGRVQRVAGGATSLVLDITTQVSTGGEQGLLGLTFSPDGARLYVNFTNTAGDTRVVSYAMAANVATAGSARQILAVEQPFSNHNGGQVTFGPDGMLYVGLGDGGSARDPQNNGQRLDTLLGKLLRIDPTASGTPPYAIPSGNPFASTAGARPEIWAWGLRNPWRFSFDRLTGDLWIGDVGQSAREEIDFRAAGTAAGANFGWARMEGSVVASGSPPPGHVLPLVEYDSGAGGTCAVTGGYVYRGARIPRLRGAYVYGDFCAGHLLALVQSGGTVAASRGLGVVVSDLASFGEDHAGELYALSLDGRVFRLDPAP